MRNRRVGAKKGKRKFRIHSADEKSFLLIDISARDSTQHCAYLKYHISCWRRRWIFLDDSSQYCGLFFIKYSELSYDEEWKWILDLLWSRRIKWSQRMCRQSWSKKVFSSRWFSRFNGGYFPSSTCAIFGVCFFGALMENFNLSSLRVLMLHEISHRLTIWKILFCFFVDSQNSKLETHKHNLKLQYALNLIWILLFHFKSHLIPSLIHLLCLSRACFLSLFCLFRNHQHFACAEREVAAAKKKKK